MTRPSVCSRFTQRSDDAYLWDSGVLTTFQYGANNAWTQTTAWDGTMQRDYFHLAANNTESWKDGLPYKMEAYAAGQTPGVSTAKKTTLLTWANEATWGRRVTDTTVTDGENNRSRFVSYLFGTYNLQVRVTETDITGGANIQLRRTDTSYLTGNPYIRASGTANNASNPSLVQRWIVGVPTAVYSYDGASNLLAKVTYAYDQTTYAGENLLVHQTPAAGTIFNYNPDFAVTSGTNAILARGNLTNVTRWDITYGGCGCAGGAVVTTTDEVGRQQRLTRDAYLDSTTQVDKAELLNANGTTYSTTVTRYKSNERKAYVWEFQARLRRTAVVPLARVRKRGRKAMVTAERCRGIVRLKRALPAMNTLPMMRSRK